MCVPRKLCSNYANPAGLELRSVWWNSSMRWFMLLDISAIKRSGTSLIDRSNTCEIGNRDYQNLIFSFCPQNHGIKIDLFRERNPYQVGICKGFQFWLILICLELYGPVTLYCYQTVIARCLFQSCWQYRWFYFIPMCRLVGTWNDILLINDEIYAELPFP